MKVAVVHFSLNFVGGAERLCLTTISALKNAGHSVTLVTIEKTDWKLVQESFAEYSRPDRELYLFSAKLSKRMSNSILAAILYLGYLFEHVFVKVWGKHDVILSTFGDLIYSIADVVYVHAPLKASDKLSQILPITNAVKWRFQSKLYNLSLFIFNYVPARIILANSTFIKRVVADSLEADAYVVSPPVDVTYFSCSDKQGFRLRQNKVVTLSGYSPKRCLERVPMVASNTKLGNFVIIGKADEYSSATIQNLKAIIESCKLESRVELLFNLSRLKVRDALAESKIYLHTMPNEHFGTAIVEAMASGCIPIVHKSGGPWLDILEQKQGEYGYAYETLKEASAYVDLLLSEEDLRKRTASRAAQRSLNYASSIFARKIVKIVEIVYELKKAKNKRSLQ